MAIHPYGAVARGANSPRRGEGVGWMVFTAGTVALLESASVRHLDQAVLTNWRC
jgi:hypothetical protein